MELREFFGDTPTCRKLEAIRELYAIREPLLRYLHTNPYLSKLLFHELGNQASVATTIASVVENIGSRSKIERRLERLAWTSPNLSVESFERTASDFLLELGFYLKQEHASLVAQIETFRPELLDSFGCEDLLAAWNDNSPGAEIARAATCVATLRQAFSEQIVETTAYIRQVRDELQQAGFLEKVLPVSGDASVQENLATINDMFRSASLPQAIPQVRTTYESLTKFFEYSLAVESQTEAPMVPRSRDASLTEELPADRPGEAEGSADGRARPRRSKTRGARKGGEPVSIQKLLEDARRGLDQLDYVSVNNETLEEAIPMLRLVRDVLMGLLASVRAFLAYVRSIITNAKVVSAGVNTLDIDRELRRVDGLTGYAFLATSAEVVDSVKMQFSRAWAPGAARPDGPGPAQGA